MTSGSGGFGFGSGGRHRGRFSESTKSVAAILTGGAALLIAVAGTITLVCSYPPGSPASAVTTTAVGVGDAPGGGTAGGGMPGSGTAAGGTSSTDTPSGGGAAPATSGSSGASSSVPSPTSSAPATTTTSPYPPASSGPSPQWDGDLQVDATGYSLATVPPSPDKSGNPDISASFDGTFVAGLGAAKWTVAAPPSPQACAMLIMAQEATRVAADPGDVFCVRVAHQPYNVGNQYAAVQVVGQGLDTSGFPYVRIHATVWPDAGLA